MTTRSFPTLPGARREKLDSLSVLLTSGPSALEQRLEFTARGERVAAQIRIPSDSAPPHPLAIFVDDVAPESPAPDRERHLAQGIATVHLNWPLLGARRSPKMSRQLLADLTGAKAGSPSVLVRQFLAQAEQEFSCLLDATQAIRGLDPHRILHLEFCLTPTRPAGESAEAPSGHPDEAVRQRQGGAETTIKTADAPRLLADFLQTLRI